MRSLFFAALVSVAALFSSAAFAQADLDTMAAYDFSGAYAGVHVGAGIGDAEWTNVGTSATFGPIGSSSDLDPDGFLAGGQIGYMHQMDSFVYGVDLSLSFSDIDDKASSPSLALTPRPATVDVDTIVLAQARLGWSHDRWLFFAQGGYAGAEGTAFGTVPLCCNSEKDVKWHHGWTIGGGVMVMIDQAFSIGAEYNYVDLATRKYNVDLFGPGDRADIDHEIHVFKVTATIHLGHLFGGK